jgi:predicted RNA-binding protein associated with RNAse of E/G family
MAQGIANGELDQNGIAQAVQQGAVSPEVAQVAIGMAQQMQAATEAQYNAQQGLGGQISQGY